MSIQHPCCVPDGLVFNVDSRHCQAKGGGGTDDLAAAWEGPAPVPAGVERADYFEEDGTVRIYSPQFTPTPAVV